MKEAWQGYGLRQAEKSSAVDAGRFKIQEFMQIGSYLAVRINYPNCTNYEGDKVLVYDGVEYEELRKRTRIDPHFSRGQERAPIARFEPTAQGWLHALKFCSMLHSEHVETAY